MIDMVGASPITREIFNGNGNVDDDVVLLNKRNTACVVTFAHILFLEPFLPTTQITVM